MTSRVHKLYQSIDLDQNRAGKISGLIALMLMVAFIVVTRPSIHGNDGVQNYVYLRSMMFDGDLDFSNEYNVFISREADWFDKKQIPRDSVTNLPINLYGVGNSVLWTPWVLFAHGGAFLLGKLGIQTPALDGYSPLYGWAVGYASCFYATIGLWLLFRLLRSMCGEVAASWSLFLIWLASPLFFYMYLHPSMSHANSFFVATLVLVQYLKHPQKWWRWGLLGLTCGLMTIIRFQDGILLLALLVGELWNLKVAQNARWAYLRRHVPLYCWWFAGFAISIVPQLLVWNYLQGSFHSGPKAYTTQGDFSFLTPTHVVDVLFSSNHGVFYWHPALLIAFTGLLVSGFYLREKLMGFSAFVGQTWIVASWSIWWAGASFGHRMFISLLPFLAIGALFIVGRKGRFGTALRVIMLVCILWNFGCIIQYGLGWISRQKSVPLSELAHNNFVRIPNLILKSFSSSNSDLP